MADLFDGMPDPRQAGAIETTRFRPRYRQLSPDEVRTHDALKSAASQLEGLFDGLPPGREASIAMTKLEESIMWAVKGLTK